jgi:hypothetical protein
MRKVNMVEEYARSEPLSMKEWRDVFVEIEENLH